MVHNECNIVDGKLSFFAFDVYLPDEMSSRFFIFADLAEMFGVEYNADAARRLRKTLSVRSEYRKKVHINHEADRVSAGASGPAAGLLVALTINELCVPKYKRPVTQETEEALAKVLGSWKRPKAQKWRPGDVFMIPFLDGTYGYGQVLDGYSTCALFDMRTEAPVRSVGSVGNLQILTILTVGQDQLAKSIWKVLENNPIVADPDSGPCGPRFAVGSISFGRGRTLTELAEAYYGLLPWNVGLCGDDDYYAKLLMRGIGRPDSAWVLTQEEREEYRRDHGIKG